MAAASITRATTHIHTGNGSGGLPDREFVGIQGKSSEPDAGML